MRIKGYSYPGYVLCCQCDPHKHGEERFPVFEHEDGAITFYCDECGLGFADTWGELNDSAYCNECGADKGEGKALCAACDESLVGDEERRLLKKAQLLEKES